MPVRCSCQMPPERNNLNFTPPLLWATVHIIHNPNSYYEWVSRGDAPSLCWSQEGVWFTVSQGTVGSSASPWDSYRDYWSINWPVLRDSKCCEVCVCVCGCERGSYPASFLRIQGCVLAPSLFNTSMDLVLGRVVNQSHCGAPVSNTKNTDLVFANDAVIFAESLKALVMALGVLHEEVKPLV